jgi:hypothetical protein
MLDVFLFPRHETRNGPGFHLSRSLTHRGTFHAMGDTESDRVLKQPPNTRLIRHLLTQVIKSHDPGRV